MTAPSSYLVHVSKFRSSLSIVGAALIGLSLQTAGTHAASPPLPEVVVSGVAPAGAYGQPAWASHSRTSPTTNGYVLSPFNVYTSVIWEGLAPRSAKGMDTFTEEIEIGLPARFQIAFEDNIEQYGHYVENDTTSVEARYAFADWDKIPLNPTVFGEYKFGTGKELDDPDKVRTPDSFELRLLLSQDFNRDIHWSFNAFCEQELSQDREREIGFSQSLVYAPEGSRLQYGMEMQLDSRTDQDTRAHAQASFVIGPSLGYQLTSRARIDIAPLFGIGKVSPTVDAFVVVSYQFGGGSEGSEAHAPVSTQNR